MSTDENILLLCTEAIYILILWAISLIFVFGESVLAIAGLMYDCRFMGNSYILVLFCGLFTIGFSGYQIRSRSGNKCVQTLCTVCAAICLVIYILLLFAASLTLCPAYRVFQNGMEKCSRNTTIYCEYGECKRPLITCAVVAISLDWVFVLGLIVLGCHNRRTGTVSSG